MKIRQSSLGAFDACPRRLQYSLESPPDVYHSGIVRAVGTAYHAGLEYYYLGSMEQRGWLVELAEVQDMAHSSLNDEIERAGEHFIWDDKFPDFNSAVATIDHMLDLYFHDGHAWPVEWKVLGVELSFDIEYHGHILHGTMDLALEDPNGFVYGVDHKTAGRMWPQGKEHARKNNQAPFYVNALKQMFPDAPGHLFVFDIMTYAGKFERRVSSPNEGHIAAVLDKGLAIASLYDGMRANGMELPTNPSSTLCSPKFCDFFDICPSGAILDV